MATREEKIANLAIKRTEIEGLVKDFNAANQDGKAEDARKLDAKIDEAINEYTADARTIVFDDCKDAENPMIEAVTRLTFTTIACKDEQADEDAVPVRTLIEKERPIDLLKLHKYCGGIGADENWYHLGEKLNFLMTAAVCKELGIDCKEVNNSYAMTEIARSIDMGKNPFSNTNELKTLQMVITAMLGEEYKATSHDVRFLQRVFAKKGRAKLSIVAANHNNFRGYLAEICHRIVTNGVYTVDYQKIKQ